MYNNAKILSIVALLSSLAITPVIADDWPKRGLAANEDVPIWQVCTHLIPILFLSESVLFGRRLSTETLNRVLLRLPLRNF